MTLEGTLEAVRFMEILKAAGGSEFSFFLASDWNSLTSDEAWLHISGFVTQHTFASSFQRRNRHESRDTIAGQATDIRRVSKSPLTAPARTFEADLCRQANRVTSCD